MFSCVCLRPRRSTADATYDLTAFVRIAELFPTTDDAFPGNQSWLPRFQTLSPYLHVRTAAEAMGVDVHIARQAMNAMMASGMPADVSLMMDVVGSITAANNSVTLGSAGRA